MWWTMNIDALKDKRLEIENAICDLYKDVNYAMLSEEISDEKDCGSAIRLQRLCVDWLRRSVY